MRSPFVLLSLLSLSISLPPTARAAGEFSLPVQIGPVTRSSGETRSLTFDRAILKQQSHSFDVQDGREHNVRGVSLRELLKLAKAPKAVDTALFVYSDGMQIPVRLNDKEEVDAIFIALEHGNVRDEFGPAYPLQDKAELACPKVVYGRKVTAYSIWIYPGQLASVRLVTWKLHEANLAQATRRAPDRSGWPIFIRNCQPCHGIGHQGATRGPDFLSDMEAYRRVPALAKTDVSQHPSLHEKVKGFADGTMPVLNHVSNDEIATLWRWLHSIHDGSVK